MGEAESFPPRTPSTPTASGGPCRGPARWCLVNVESEAQPAQRGPQLGAWLGAQGVPCRERRSRHRPVERRLQQLFREQQTSGK